MEPAEWAAQGHGVIRVYRGTKAFTGLRPWDLGYVPLPNYHENPCAP